ncbi:MAG: neopullulanase, partial [Anaerophaga sp.]|nr:neopullulanase [Anaerophaga sp.]
MRKVNIVLILVFIALTNLLSNVNAARNIKDRLEPSSWWIGFKNPVVQLMAYSEDIGLLRPEINHPGLTIKQITGVENPNY